MNTKAILLLALSLAIFAGVGFQIYYDSTVPTFDPDFAIDIDYYSKASYCDIANIRQWNCGATCERHPGMTEVKAFSSLVSQIQGYCGYDSGNNRIVVAYRGSSNVNNWITDFVYHPVAYPDCEGCLVHQGFKVALSEVSIGINACVSVLALKHPTAKVIVTGHSLGGAVATLSALEVAKIVNPSKITFMNFGSPRVGNQQFFDFFMSVLPKGMRVVNYRDIVPHVPLQAMNFKHVNYEIWMLSNGAVNNFKVCPIEEDPSCSDSLKIYSAADHTNYFGFDTGC